MDKKVPLFKKDFTLVVIGQIISLFGNAILRFALPLYLLRETGSSTLFGTVTACSFLPMIVLSLVGGVMADRVNKRNIMVILDFSTAALITVFYLLLGHIPIIPLFIVCLMILYGISGTYQPAVQASIPALVAPEKLMAGNAVINQISTLSGLLGPIIGGILFGVWGILPILLVSIGCFLVSAIMEIFIQIPYKKQSTDKGIFAIACCDLKEGWRFVRQEKPAFISVVIVLAAFNMVLSSAIIVGIPIMIVNVLHMSDSSLGFAQGILGLGGLAGGLSAGFLAPRLKIRHSYLLLLFCALASGVMGIALLPGLPPAAGYGLIVAMSFLAMSASTLFTIQMATLVQIQTPPHLVGKIMAAIMAAAMCAQPLGQALYGILFDVCADIPWVVMIGGAAAALVISLYSKKAFLQLEHQ